MLLTRLLLTYRTFNRISLQTLAKDIGIPKSALWRFETGKPVEDKKLARILKYVLTENT